MFFRSSKKGNFYITTTLPYVNSEPHMGHALEFVRADIIARYKKLQGFNVFFNTGTDEHGIKIYRKAIESGKTPQEYVDIYADKFKKVLNLLGISEDANFVRTTDENHIKSAQEFWKVCNKNGYIYKKNYKVKYCVGCELEKTDSDLVNGKCPDHPNLVIENIDEENYFFKFSDFQKPLLNFYKKNPNFVIPESRFNEIRAFVERGLQDFSVSRLKEKMPWGIEVPGDQKHVMYVWFDALENYISVIGWPTDMKKFEEWHNKKNGMVQYCGKDNLRQQSAMWQAMLMAAGLPNSQKIIIDGFITGGGGVKMSKSIGNVVNPVDLVNEYGTDALRYYVAREAHPFEDSEFTIEKFKETYNANLANGLGNLVSRVMKMATVNNIILEEKDIKEFARTKSAKMMYEKQIEGFEKYNLQIVTDAVWEMISSLDKDIQTNEPFKKIKVDKKAGEKDIKRLLAGIEIVATALLPILPKTAQKIKDCLAQNKMPEAPLFARKD